MHLTMRAWRSVVSDGVEGNAQKPNRRRHGRLLCDGLTCSLGKVIDLSASGMGVEGRGRPVVGVGEHLSVRLTYGDETIHLGTQVVRITKVGLRRYRYALEFVGVPPEARALLTRLAAAVCERRLLV